MRKFLYWSWLRWWILCLCISTLVSWLVLKSLPDGHLHAYFLDVGQGDSILLRLPHGGTVLVDGGPGSNVVEPLRRAVGWLSGKIDLVVITHFDRDHVEGFLKVFEDYHVGHVLMTGVEQKTELQKTIITMIAAKKIPVWIASSDSDFLLDDAVIMDILSPFQSLAGKYYKDANDTSIVARILVGRDHDFMNYSGVFDVRSAILMTGDAGFEIEKKMIARYGASGELRADILKVGHHGSQYSSSEDFLAHIRAQFAIISVGAKNSYHHPGPDTMERLVEMTGSRNGILRTDTMGAIEKVF